MEIDNCMKEEWILSEINKVKMLEWKSHARYGPLGLVHKNSPGAISISEMGQFCKFTDSTIGSWTLAQSRNYRGWYGPGTWQGYFTGLHGVLKLVINIYDRRIVDILASDADLLAKYETKLNVLLTKWQVLPSQLTTGHSTHYYNGKINSDNGSPIYMMQEDIIDDLSEPVHLSIRGQSMQIMQGKNTVYTFKGKKSMIMSSLPAKKTIMDYILDNYAIPAHEMHKFLTSADPSRLVRQSQEWLKSLLQDFSPSGAAPPMALLRPLPPETKLLAFSEFYSMVTGSEMREFMSNYDHSTPKDDMRMCDAMVFDVCPDLLDLAIEEENFEISKFDLAFLRPTIDCLTRAYNKIQNEVELTITEKELWNLIGAHNVEPFTHSFGIGLDDMEWIARSPQVSPEKRG